MEQIARNVNQIAAAVRRRRRKLGLSQKELGGKIKLRQATLSRLEAGEPAVRLSTLLDALSALNLEIVIRPRTRGSASEIEAMFS